ncbi:MAG: hypothetical protein SVV80_05515 [Planctomycetota bacterium]|nr:hypothetical protein [Planctomycetota bacterium]
MKRNRNILCLAWWIVLGSLLTGCRTPDTSAPPTQSPSAKIDPCAERLHDVCGQLLLYHSIHKRLPQKLDEMKTMDIGYMPQLICPVSGKPYVYNPEGLRIPGRTGRLVLYDAIACHSGMRWGILVEDPANGKPLTARVILLPEKSVSSVGKSP